MERIKVVGCAAVMVLMAVSFCFAADNTQWFSGDITSIGQGAQGFKSVQNAWDTSAYEPSLKGLKSAWDLSAGELDLKGSTFFKQLSADGPALKENSFFKQLSAGEPSWAAIQKGWNLAGGEPSLAGLQSAWDTSAYEPSLRGWDTSAYESSLIGAEGFLHSAAAEPSGICGNWGSGNLIMNTTDGLDEYAKLKLSNFIRPFVEKGLAAMTPQQDIHSFIADAKAGKVSMEQARAYVNQFQANQDAFQAACGAAFNEWMEQYKDQGLMWF